MSDAPMQIVLNKDSPHRLAALIIVGTSAIIRDPSVNTHSRQTPGNGSAPTK
jgi:hypothetical protein